MQWLISLDAFHRVCLVRAVPEGPCLTITHSDHTGISMQCIPGRVWRSKEGLHWRGNQHAGLYWGSCVG